MDENPYEGLSQFGQLMLWIGIIGLIGLVVTGLVGAGG